MGKDFEKKSLEHASEEWLERLKHEEVMEKLSGIRGYKVKVNCDYGYCFNWKVDAPKTEELREIVKRGVSEEILYLIHQYGRALPPKDKPLGCTTCNGGKWEVTVIPDEIQEMIAKRGLAVEMAAFVSYYGFGAKGQDAILERGNHNEIMWYLSHHGLLLQQQRKLFERGNKDEIYIHILRHGLHDALLDEMFEKMKNGECIDLFYQYIDGQEFSVRNQIKMLNVVGKDEFRAYVSRYGLWEEVHKELLEKRSKRDVRFYVIQHRYLSREAAYKYIEKSVSDERIFFMKNAVSGVYFAMQKLMMMKPYDFASLEYGFENYPYKPSDENIHERNLILNGSDAQIIDYVKTNRFMRMKSWATLFYQGNLKLFGKCLDILNE